MAEEGEVPSKKHKWGLGIFLRGPYSGGQGWSLSVLPGCDQTHFPLHHQPPTVAPAFLPTCSPTPPGLSGCSDYAESATG